MPSPIEALPGRWSSVDGEELPLSVHALEPVHAAVGEGDTGSRYEVGDRAGHQNLVRFGEGLDAGRDVYRNASDVTLARLHLTCVQPGPDLNVERAQRGAEVKSTGDGAGRGVEGGEHPVAGRLDDAPAAAIDVLRCHLIVVVEQLTPTQVAQSRGPLGRADDVGTTPSPTRAQCRDGGGYR